MKHARSRMRKLLSASKWGLIFFLRKNLNWLEKQIWRFLTEDCRKEWLLILREDYPFCDAEINVEDATIAQSFRRYNDVRQYEYLIKYPCRAVIEPKFGWVISQNRLVFESLPYSREIPIPTPSLSNYLRVKLFGAGDIRKESRVVSLRNWAETNYWHFFNDVLGKIMLIDRMNLEADLPLVISKSLYEKKFFQGALRRGVLDHRTFVIQNEFYIEAEEFYFCKPMPHSKEYLEQILDYLNIPVSDDKSDRRVFLARNTSRGRHLSNTKQIEEVCSRFGFEIVDTDDMELDSQIELFSGARYVIGVHGAGLTNIIFRRGGRLSLLELFPADQIPPHYYWLSLMFGFEYSALLGQEGAGSAFEIDPYLLQDKIKALLN